jgi:hypothetical protein
VQRKS